MFPSRQGRASPQTHGTLHRGAGSLFLQSFGQRLASTLLEGAGEALAAQPVRGMAQCHPRMPHKHPRSGIAHHPAHPLPHVRRIAVDGAAGAEAFIRTLGAVSKALKPIGEELGAVRAEHRFPMLAPAADLDHAGEDLRLLFKCDPSTVLSHDLPSLSLPHRSIPPTAPDLQTKKGRMPANGRRYRLMVRFTSPWKFHCMGMRSGRKGTRTARRSTGSNRIHHSLFCIMASFTGSIAVPTLHSP